jgi:hypothetical protein
MPASKQVPLPCDSVFTWSQPVDSVSPEDSELEDGEFHTVMSKKKKRARHSARVEAARTRSPQVILRTLVYCATRDMYATLFLSFVFACVFEGVLLQRRRMRSDNDSPVQLPSPKVICIFYCSTALRLTCILKQRPYW